MSYSIFVPCPMPPDVVETLDEVGVEDLLCEEVRDVPKAGHWPEGFIYHFYRPQISTRSIEVSFERDEFLVRLLANASREDYALAFAFVDAVCAITETGPIETSDFEELNVDEFASKHDIDWIDERRRADARNLFEVATEDGALVGIQGPTRDFYAGPSTIARLETPDPDRLEAAIRHVFYLDETRYPEASTIDLEISGVELVARKIEPGRAAFVGRCDLFAFEGHDGPVYVSLADVDEVLPERRLVDEVQFTVDAIEGDAWTRTLSLAREHQISLESLEKPRRWWKFWK